MSRMTNRPRPLECSDGSAPAPGLGAGERERLVAGFRALGDPSRLEIFRLIASRTEPICACDVVARFELSQPTISHHLKVLREAGLVTVSRRGVWAYYAVDPSGLASLGEALAALAPEQFAAAS